MYAYTKEQMEFIDKWVRGMMDIKGEYRLLQPDFKENMSPEQAFVCIDIKHDYSWTLFRTGLNIKSLEFIVNIIEESKR